MPLSPIRARWRSFKKNIELNAGVASKINCHALALSDQASEAEFFVSRFTARGDARRMNTGTSSLYFDANRHRPQDKIRVRMDRLDHVLQFAGQRVVVKVDVEGHEFAVLRGVEQLLRDNECLVLFEAIGGVESALQDYFKTLGYHDANAVATHEQRNCVYIKRSLTS